jgi:mRNA interferase MazF
MKGEVVIVPFPFSNLEVKKRRPALILIDSSRGDDIVCAAITRSDSDPNGISLENADFQSGGLPVSSTIRPTKIFTIERRLIESVRGRIAESKRAEVVKKLNILLA